MIIQEYQKHIVPVTVATIVAAVVGIGAAGIMRPAPQQQVVSTTGKPNPLAWGELTQKEVDALTAILKTVPKKSVGIFCSNRDCEDMALDFDNAFESAKWESGIERPLVDANVGINVGPPNQDGKWLASAIDRATAGRIKPGLLEAQIIGENRLVLVISRKAR